MIDQSPNRALFLGGPLHRQSLYVDGWPPHFCAPVPAERCLTINGPCAVAMPKLERIVYHIKRFRWANGNEIRLYSCIDDEYWMEQHLAPIVKSAERMEPWLKNRLWLANELTKLGDEIEKRLQNSAYARNFDFEKMGRVKLQMAVLKRRFLDEGQHE